MLCRGTITLPRLNAYRAVVAAARAHHARGSSTAPMPISPDLVALAGPAAGLAVLAAVAVIAETRLLRRRGVPGLLRIGG